MEYHMARVYRLSNDNLLQEIIDNEVIMMDLSSQAFYVLNATGSFIWVLLKHGCNVATIVNLVADQYNLASKNVREPVKAFVDQLLAERLIVEQDVALTTIPSVPAGMISATSGFMQPLISVFTDMGSMRASMGNPNPP
jgi:hypothetical protein